MNELYLIMQDFLKSEYEIKAFIALLEVLENSYSEEKQLETKAIASVVKTYLISLQKEINSTLNTMDNYLVAAAQILN